MNVGQLLDRARESGKFASDRELGRALDLKGAAVSQFRKGQARPSEPTIVKLAELAGVDPREAVLDLVMSKETDRKTLEVWRSIRKRLSAAVMIGTITCAATAAHAAAVGSTNSEQAAMTTGTLYIITNRRRRSRVRIYTARRTFLRKSQHTQRREALHGCRARSAPLWAGHYNPTPIRGLVS